MSELKDYRLRYGLLGRKLGHSYSPQIHKLLGGYEYGLFERQPDQLEQFFREGTFRGINVTIPYKRDAISFCDALSETAEKCASVNTIIRSEDGTYFGDNTDYHGFKSTVLCSGIDVRGAKTIVLGSGGVSGTVAQVMQDLGAAPVTVISRSGADNYENISRHFDAQIIVNTTPVGMFPEAGHAVIDIRNFCSCKAVFDLIYNPLRTRLMLDAREVGIPAFGGLHMLAAQAAKACELFLGSRIDLERETQRACRKLREEIENIVLIGMPGCGKTTIGRKLAQLSGKPFVDCDERIREIYGRSAEKIIREDGIDRFREAESLVIRQVMRRGPQPDGSTPGIIFAAGGGCVEREENKVPLLENSTAVYIKRDINNLPTEGRPVSQADGTQAIFDRRKDRYEGWSDLAVDCSETAAEEILHHITEREMI